MSQHDSSTKGTTIKIAAKEASQRNQSGGQEADPGPGDISAAPSTAPQVVDIPAPPTGSQLVVKSTSTSKKSSNLPTLNEARSGTGPSTKGGSSAGPKSSVGNSASGAHASSKHLSGAGSQMGPAASHPSHAGSAREPTSSKVLTGVHESKVDISMGGTVAKSTASGAGKSAKQPGSKLGASSPGTGAPTSNAAAAAAAGSSVQPKSATGHTKSAASGAPPKSVSPITASTAMQADSGVVHDEDEEGEGELEHPDEPSPAGSASPSPSGSAAAAAASAVKSGKGQQSKSAAGSGVGGAGGSGMGAEGPSMTTSDMKSGGGHSGAADKDKKNKVTKFRYHKRIVVRTKGNANPSSIMDKVNKKAGNTRLTPSTIEDMDPQELMKRAGIKGTNKTHWRVRLRQTKRLTKNGKTTTQTKVAYRDSEGNKRVKTSQSPFCKTCGKKLEECKCESNSQA